MFLRHQGSPTELCRQDGTVRVRVKSPLLGWGDLKLLKFEELPKFHYGGLNLQREGGSPAGSTEGADTNQWNLDDSEANVQEPDTVVVERGRARGVDGSAQL